MSRSNSFQFRATIASVGIVRYVPVPLKISRSLGSGQFVAVAGEIEGITFRSTLTPRGQGAYRLPVHSRIWRKLGVDRGDVIRVTLRRAPEPGRVKLPADVRAALESRGALAAFERITPRLQLEFLRWINAAKREGTRLRRLEVGAQRLIAYSMRRRKS